MPRPSHPPLFDHPNIIWISQRSLSNMSRVTERGVEAQLYSILTSALDEVSGQRHAPVAFTLGQSPGTQFVEG